MRWQKEQCWAILKTYSVVNMTVLTLTLQIKKESLVEIIIILFKEVFNTFKTGSLILPLNPFKSK